MEGRNVNIEYRWPEGRKERYAEIAAEFVRLKVDVIVTSGTLPVIVAKQTTSVIPIVFATAGDPVGNRLVASLARPGGNVTGLSIQSVDLAGKRLELLRERPSMLIVTFSSLVPSLLDLRLDLGDTRLDIGLLAGTRSSAATPRPMTPAETTAFVQKQQSLGSSAGRYRPAGDAEVIFRPGGPEQQLRPGIDTAEHALLHSFLRSCATAVSSPLSQEPSRTSETFLPCALANSCASLLAGISASIHQGC